ncbi:MAG: TIM barrel protein [Conexivisphaera sp.]
MPSTPDSLRFGPAGVPRSSHRASTEEGILRVAELGLGAMEVEFVRGVRMSAEAAGRVRDAASSSGILLTVHAPYYVNLLSDDEAKVRASVDRILESARVGAAAGAWSVAFHPGYYGKLDSATAVARVRELLSEVTRRLRDEGIDVWVRPETMGGLAEVGSVDEVLDIVEGVDGSLPCLDFAHIYARSLGSVNSRDAVRELLARIESRLGREAFVNFHAHISGMEYGPRGERRHLPLEESEFRWRDALSALREFNPRGAIICESPLLEDDALLMKKYYEGLGRRRARGARV